MRNQKSKKFISGKLLPLTLVLMLVISMVAIAFTANTVDAAEYELPAVPVAKDSEDSAHWVKATYFDYLTDDERGAAGWLSPEKSGTGYNGSKDNWYPYDEFNQIISDNAGAWDYPLYLGNFCNNFDAYPNATKAHGGPYNVKSQLTNFNYYANNSNGLSDFHAAVRGLVGKSLDSSGNLLTNNSAVMPYFNKTFLTSNKMATVFDSKFPFTQTKLGPKVTKYEFDSTNGKDNVYFNWKGADKKTPESVAYGSGAAYAVSDGLDLFMDGQESGKGIFPFNRADGNGGSENLDYGFGIRMDMDFKVPKDGMAVLDDGTRQPVYFDYSGDDDLWVYISEADGSNSKLVLDLGGDHKMAHGHIDFAAMTSKVDQYVDISKQAQHSSDGLLIYDNFGWGKNMRVWAWNDAGASGWFVPTHDPRAGEEEIKNNTYAKVYNVSENQMSKDGTHKFSEMTNFKIYRTEDNNAKALYLGISGDQEGYKDWQDVKVWAWKDGDANLTGEFFDTTAYKVDENTTYYVVNDDAVGSKGHKLGDCEMFKLADRAEWTADTKQTPDDKNQKLKNHWDQVVYNDNLAWDGGKQMAPDLKKSDYETNMLYTSDPSYLSGHDDVIPWAYTEGVEEPFTIGKTSSASGKTRTGQNLDPNKTYHMTIFYMERGMLESNCRMGFTMTPAQNFLEVTNRVNLTDLNPALVDPIKSGENFNFTSTNTANSGADDVDPTYKDDINDPDETNADVNGSKRYDNKFDTGSDLHVTQKEDTILKYDTTWNIVDIADDKKEIAKYDKDDASQDSKDCNLFKLINGKDPYDDASMQVNFINTPKVGNVILNKDILDPEGAKKTSSEEFTYKFNLTIPKVANTAFPLSYYLVDENADPDTVSVDGVTEQRMAADGTFKFPADKAVLIKGLPLDAQYTVTETDSGSYVNKTGSVTGVVGTNKSQVFENQETTAPPTTAPPTTEPPTTEPPTTEPPTTEPPTTEPPTTEPPTTEPPTTEPPTTEPPTTEPPTTEPPTTEPPTTQPPTTQPPTTQPPTEPPTTIPPKENEPKINKIIVDSKFTPYYTTAAIGETVKFRLTAVTTGSVVNKLNAYTIVDTMSEGLTFGKVKSVSLVGAETLKLSSDQYKVTKTDEGFEVSLAKDVLQKDAFYSYQKVVVDCTATLNKDAVIGAEGNPNEDSLKWTTADGKNHDKEGNEVVVYTFQIDVNKVDAKTDEAVPGCVFEIYKSADDAKKGENAIMKATSDEDGIASFVGLDGGKYYVKETKALKGYNLNSKVYTVNIKPKFNSDGELTGPEDGIVNTTIENTKPDVVKTGGNAGTIWFGAIGAGFLAAAGVILFFALRKKTTAK